MLGTLSLLHCVYSASATSASILGGSCGVRYNASKQYAEILGHNRCRRIFDASELFFQISSDTMTTRSTSSKYKSHHTKFLASIEPSGGFDFVSDAYGGQIEDIELTKIGGLLSIVEEGDVNLAERGFLLKHLFNAEMELLHPPKSWNGQQYFTEEESEYTSDIARLRIHVERAFARVKQFQSRCSVRN
jgi:hypothetical protein